MSTAQLVGLRFEIWVVKFQKAYLARVSIILGKRTVYIGELLSEFGVELEANLEDELFLLLEPIFF